MITELKEEIKFHEINYENPIVFFGDSHTRAFHLSKTFPNKKIINKGIYGNTIGALLARVSDITSRNPSKVFILAGTNDIVRHKTPLSKCISDYLALLDSIKLKCPETKIYLQSVPPVKEKNLEIIQLNRLIRELAKQKDAIYIDLYSAINENDSLGLTYDYGDGIHLSSQAYKKWAALLKPYL